MSERVAAVVDERTVTTVYQPIVDLDDGSVVGAEGLSRGPRGTALESPDSLFPAARAAGYEIELDRLCATLALEGAHAQGFEGHLFVNLNPGTIRTGWDLPTGSSDVVLEVTERALLDDPASLLASIDRMRRDGLRIALDDVGANPDTLTLLPLVAPDVVKLDMSLIRNRPDSHLGRVMVAVLAYAERSGARILAEGIENEHHVAQARMLGATWGQGWHFSRAEERLPTCIRSSDVGTSLVPESVATPFDLAARHDRRVVTATKAALLELSLRLEALAGLHQDSIILSAFQHAASFTPATQRRYAGLAARCQLVAAFGTELDRSPLAGVRGAPLTPEDPLVDEWTVVVMGAQHHAALIASDRHEGQGRERRFDYFVTHDRALVEAAARSLLARVDSI